MAAGDKQNLAGLLRAGGYEEDGMGYSQNLAETSQPVRKRIRALKKLQIESINVESKFYQRVHEIEKEFQPLFEEIHKKRAAIVKGEHEPTDEECEAKLVHDLGEDELKKLEDAAPVEGTPTKGIPDFWYYALNNVGQIGDMIRDYDVPILKHLTEISSEIHSDPDGFTLRFHFEPNQYFSNTVIEKYYKLQLTPDAEDPFDYDGPMVTATKGTKIDWKPEMNVTQKVVKKKQKKGSGAGRFITKTVKTDSFFNFFDPPVTEMTEELDETESETLRSDFEIGQIIRDQIIPRAVLFFTGEAADEDDFDFGDEFEDGEDGESEAEPSDDE
jgi:hypothetical protein